MEEKKLNFNLPLLSVRRFSATTVSSEADNKRKTAKSLTKLPPLPAYKSELKSGPVRNPGTVPFVWEQIPGRPKDESRSKNQALEGPVVAPKLPPGRVSKVKKQGFDKGSKGTTAAQSQTGNVLSDSQNVSTLMRKIATKNESSNEGMEDRTGSEDVDENFLDALDALSRTESAYMNCSVSGLSRLDGLDIIPSGTFSTDPQTRDFMMGRFLPAAKAMASETPQYAPRKQPVAREQPISREEPRRMRKVVTGDKRHQLNQLNQYRPNVQDIAGEVSEDEGMRMPVQVPISSVRRVHAKSSYAGSYNEARKKHTGSDVYKQTLINGDQEAVLREDNIDLKRESNQISNRSDGLTLVGSSVNRCLQGSGISPYRNECSQSILHDGKGFLGIPEKAKSSKETSSLNKHKKGRNFLELLASENAEGEVGLGSPVVEKTLYVDSVQTVKSSSSNSFSSDIKVDIKGLFDYRGNDLEIPERSGETEKTPAAESSFQDIEHLGEVNEKAVVRSKCLDFSDSSFLSSSGKSTDDVQTDAINGSIQDQEDSNKLAISKVANQRKFNLQQLEESGDQENCHSLTQECIRLTSVKLADEENTDLETQQPKTSGTDDISHGRVENSITLISSKVASKGKIDLESQRLVKLGNQESSQGNNSRLPLGPPLPKSPSESWLKRTLPTISSRNSSSQSSLGSMIYASSPVSKTSSLDPKWETIVKTSNVHHGRLRFSEELLTPIPEA